jgi:hypothetical protein
MMVFDMERWALTDQLIRVCKPLVDIIGDVEAHDATLADCMLQLIWAHREIIHMKLQDGEDQAFLDHAWCVVQTQFHAMNTDLHWLALFLHPLCRKLAISTATHSRKLKDAYRIAARIANCWSWTKEQATQLMADIKAYSMGAVPFQGGKADARDWWKSQLVSAADYPIKALAIKIFSVVPHAAEVEWLFSNLGGVQSVKCSRLTIPHLETLGMLRSHYTRQLNEAALKMGNSTCRKHAHMHMQAEPGINMERAEILLELFTLAPATPLLAADVDENLFRLEDTTLAELEEAFGRLEDQAFSSQDGDHLDTDVPLDKVYDISQLDSIWAGNVPMTVDEELDVGKDKEGNQEHWDENSLLRSLGVLN